MSTTVTVDVFVVVDGWAGSDGSLPGYFGYLGPDLEEWISAERAAPQISIMGRRTYEFLAALPQQHRDEGWEQTTQQQTLVFSRTLTRVDWPNARICRENPAEEIRQVKADSDAPLRTIRSASIARQLISAGIVDRLRLMTFPLLAGAATANRPSLTWHPPT